jgi:hypothetical protein
LSSNPSATKKKKRKKERKKMAVGETLSCAAQVNISWLTFTLEYIISRWLRTWWRPTRAVLLLVYKVELKLG